MIPAQMVAIYPSCRKRSVFPVTKMLPFHEETNAGWGVRSEHNRVVARFYALLASLIQVPQFPV
jgi:hypothetical protein